ncbi:MAG: putative metal-binding motif-containing protein, partial [Myxococcota bacterium]
DCDGQIDQGFDNQVYYIDNDEDGFGTPFPALRSCARPDGYVRNADDCDDTNPNVNPESVEVCNDGLDDDCDGISDDADPSLLPASRSTFYLDGDADGFGTVFVSFEACAPQSNWVSNADDCNDNVQEVNPAADEICNLIDDDCDSLIDDADDSIDVDSQSLVWRDFDGDGFGDPSASFLSCFPQAGFSADNPDDCNDFTALISPARTDICNGGIDDDCDPSTDENEISGQGYYVDTDGDGFGATETEVLSCDVVPGLVTRDNDCDETDTGINPAATDVCEDGIDQDCSGSDERCRAGFEVSASNATFGSNDQMRGVVLLATTPELLIDFGPRLSTLDACEIDYYVWSRLGGPGNPWVLIASDQVVHGPMFNEFALSGELDVILSPGTEYAYGAAWSNCPSNVLYGWAEETNVEDPFVLGEWQGWIRDTSYSGFNSGYTPPQFIPLATFVPHMEFGYSTSFNAP